MTTVTHLRAESFETNANHSNEQKVAHAYGSHQINGVYLLTVFPLTGAGATCEPFAGGRAVGRGDRRAELFLLTGLA